MQILTKQHTHTKLLSVNCLYLQTPWLPAVSLSDLRLWYMWYSQGISILGLQGLNISEHSNYFCQLIVHHRFDKEDDINKHSMQITGSRTSQSLVTISLSRLFWCTCRYELPWIYRQLSCELNHEQTSCKYIKFLTMNSTFKHSLVQYCELCIQ